LLLLELIPMFLVVAACRDRRCLAEIRNEFLGQNTSLDVTIIHGAKRRWLAPEDAICGRT